MMSFGEPMHLGSPSSPKTLSGPLLSTPSHYAPSFLLGTSTPANNPGSFEYGLSPNVRSFGVTQQQNAFTPQQNNAAAFKASGQKVTWSPDLVQEIPEKRATPMRSGPIIGGAPPLRTLNTELNTSTAQNSSFVHDVSTSAFNQSQLYKNKTQSPSQMDPFYTQGQDFDPKTDVDDRWVRVFGFPPQAATYILEQFARYGAIVKHEIPSNGNWMHLCYQSPLQARKALSKNAKVFANSIQIGVTPCIDKSVSERNPTVDSSLSPASAELSVFSSSQGSYALTSPRTDAPVKSSVESVSSPLDPLSPLNRSLAGMRSLTAAYEAAGSPYQVTGGVSTPHKTGESGVLSKAWTYVFGQ